jgi:predicted lipoprotein with Yx(FWY)xxD motif
MMKLKRGSILMFLSVPLIAIGLAACGGSSNSSSGSSNASAAATPVSQTAGADTVSTKSVGGVGTVLVDSKGDVLYTNNQDSASKVACTSQCMSIWPALMAPSGGKPSSSDSAVQAKLGVVNGQVTYGGKPLYTFVQDSPGQATGNGVMDSFGGTSFTWTAAMAGGGASSGSAPAASPSPSSSSASPSSSSTGSSGGSSGGYGY